MIVRELIEMLQGVDPEMQVVFMDSEDTFYSPCLSESGVIELGDPCDQEGNMVPMQDKWPTHMFALIPHPIEEEIQESGNS